MVKLYSYKFDNVVCVTEDYQEADEIGITGIMYGTETDLEPSWQDENLIYVEDVVCSTSSKNYFIEKIIACR